MNNTGRMLREREDEVFMHERYSQDTKDTNYWSRDFAYLCRGIKLVTETKFHMKKNVCELTTVAYFPEQARVQGRRPVHVVRSR